MTMERPGIPGPTPSGHRTVRYGSGWGAEKTADAVGREVNMNDTVEQQKTRIAGYMAAVERLLGGTAAVGDAFRDKVELIVGGSAANFRTLLQWAERARRTGMPMLLFSPTDEPMVPLVSLVAHVDGRTHIIESCALWLGSRDDRAKLVPDTFDMGAFSFDDELNLRHLPKAPARSLEAGIPGMRRAYGRLVDLEIAQREHRATLRPPMLLEARAA